MTKKIKLWSSQPSVSFAVLASMLSLVPLHAQAQSGGNDGMFQTAPAEEPFASKDERSGRAGTRDNRGQGAKRFEVKPYIELSQILVAEISPGDRVQTYTQPAIGADIALNGRKSGASASVRYEKQFGWGSAGNGDALSAIARGYTKLAPGLTFEAGGLATQASIENGSLGLLGSPISNDRSTSIYSLYAGPSLQTRQGDLDIRGNYRIGFTKISQSDDQDFDDLPWSSEVFDKSINHFASFETGFAPRAVLPVGVGVSGSLYQEDASMLDQRARDMQVRGFVTVPITRTTQLIGALGYEDVEVSSRDAVVDANGIPILNRRGRFTTDKTKPRVLAFDESGLLWDVGIQWRPSTQTSLYAHFGRRYGSSSFGGVFNYKPNTRTQMSVSVYDNLGGFGGQLNQTLDQLPDDFEVVRDPITGDLRGCVSSLNGGNCFSGALGSVRGSFFRARGVAANFSKKVRRIDTGIGIGYDRRNFFTPRGSVLASSNGLVDENIWLTAYASGQLGRKAGWTANAYANRFMSNQSGVGDSNGYGMTLGYHRMLLPKLRGMAAVGVNRSSWDGYEPNSFTLVSALVGLRYSL